MRVGAIAEMMTAAAMAQAMSSEGVIAAAMAVEKVVERARVESHATRIAILRIIDETHAHRWG